MGGGSCSFILAYTYLFTFEKENHNLDPNYDVFDSFLVTLINTKNVIDFDFYPYTKTLF